VLDRNRHPQAEGTPSFGNGGEWDLPLILCSLLSCSPSRVQFNYSIHLLPRPNPPNLPIHLTRLSRPLPKLLLLPHRPRNQSLTSQLPHPPPSLLRTIRLTLRTTIPLRFSISQRLPPPPSTTLISDQKPRISNTQSCLRC